MTLIPRYTITAALAFSAIGLLGCLGCSPAQEAAGTQSAEAGARASAAPDTASIIRDANSPDAEPADTPVTPEAQAEAEAAASRERAKLAEYEEQLAPYKQTVPLGTTFSLANLENAPITITTPSGEQVQAKVPTYVPWVGTLNVTVLDATLYDSLEDAQATNDLGVVLNPTPPESPSDPKLLVMRIEVTNVDATPGYTVKTPWEYFALDAFRPYSPDADEAVETRSGLGFAADLATFDGAPEGLDPQSPYGNDFALAIGETRVLTVSWWVEGAVDPALIVVRPSLSATSPGPITFDLGFGKNSSQNGDPHEPAL